MTPQTQTEDENLIILGDDFDTSIDAEAGKSEAKIEGGEDTIVSLDSPEGSDSSEVLVDSNSEQEEGVESPLAETVESDFNFGEETETEVASNEKASPDEKDTSSDLFSFDDVNTENESAEKTSEIDTNEVQDDSSSTFDFGSEGKDSSNSTLGDSFGVGEDTMIDDATDMESILGGTIAKLEKRQSVIESMKATKMEKIDSLNEQVAELKSEITELKSEVSEFEDENTKIEQNKNVLEKMKTGDQVTKTTSTKRVARTSKV